MKILLPSTLTLALLAGCHRDRTPPPHPSGLPVVVTAAPNGRVLIEVDGEGYHPATINTSPGAPVTLVFKRTTDDTCGQRVRFPALHIERDLPLNREVEIPVTAPATGSLNFTCGMGMFQGTVIAR